MHYCGIPVSFFNKRFIDRISNSYKIAGYAVEFFREIGFISINNALILKSEIDDLWSNDIELLSEVKNLSLIEKEKFHKVEKRSVAIFSKRKIANGDFYDWGENRVYKSIIPRDREIVLQILERFQNAIDELGRKTVDDHVYNYIKDMLKSNVALYKKNITKDKLLEFDFPPEILINEEINDIIDSLDSLKQQDIIPKFKRALKRKISEDQRRKIYIILGNAYEDIGDYQNAIKYYSLSIGIDDQDSLVYYYRGVVYYAIKKYHDARSDLMNAKELMSVYKSFDHDLLPRIDELLSEIEKRMAADEGLR
jgi:tetratricopeptide (TPR) repeat protein